MTKKEKKQRELKEKQEKREKQRKEEEETAAVYNDFVRSFEQSTSSKSSAPLFVRGGTINDKVYSWKLSF